MDLHKVRAKLPDFNFDGAKWQFDIQIEQLDDFCTFFEVFWCFSELLKNLSFCLFSEKIHILLNKSNFEPF